MLATPLRPLEVMVGKLTPFVLVGIIQAAVIIDHGAPAVRRADGRRLGSADPGAAAVHHRQPGLGFLISTLARNQLQAMQMSFFYFLPSILLSGFLFPFRGMPQWAQWIGSLIPVTHMLRVVRGAMLKGVGVGDVLPSLGALALFMLIVATLAVRAYRTTLD